MKKITICFASLLLVACGGQSSENKSDLSSEPFACSNFEFSNVLYINTEDGAGIESKEIYKKAEYRIVGSEFSLDGEMGDLQIRGRGNSSWQAPKKPYRLKFKDKQSLYGMASAKNYVLLAEYSDKSLLRNYMAHRMSQDLNSNGDGHRLDTRFVELCLNGQYEGFYLLTEQVAVDKNRLNIDEDLGFLIEMEEGRDRAEAEGIENQHWFELEGLYYVIKSPDVDDLLEQEDGADKVENIVSSIKSYLGSARSALVDSDKTVEDVRSYINEDQFIDYFLLNELVKNRDVSVSSVYMHRDGSNDSKLVMGPFWDFDISFGNADYGDRDGYLFESPYGFWTSSNFWFASALNKPEFKQRYIERFETVIDLYFDAWVSDLDMAAATIKPMADNNYRRWDTLGKYVWPNPKSIADEATFTGQVELLKQYLMDRKDWLVENIQSIH